MHSSTMQLLNNAKCKPQGDLVSYKTDYTALWCAEELTKFVIVVCGVSAWLMMFEAIFDTRGEQCRLCNSVHSSPHQDS